MVLHKGSKQTCIITTHRHIFEWNSKHWWICLFVEFPFCVDSLSVQFSITSVFWSFFQQPRHVISSIHKVWWIEHRIVFLSVVFPKLSIIYVHQNCLQNLHSLSLGALIVWRHDRVFPQCFVKKESVVWLIANLTRWNCKSPL